MSYKLIEKNNKKYIECVSTENPFQSLQDFMELIAACMEHETNLILLYSEVLPEEFFRLRTGLAGEVIQKFINYSIKAAIVLSEKQRIQGKFTDLMLEMNRGNSFRLINGLEEAENWLLQG